MADLEQWVNMKSLPLFVEDEVPSADRLGPNLKLTCKFKKASLAQFKIRIVPQSSAASYTKNERSRNPSFKLRQVGAKSKPVGKEVQLDAEYALPCAGGNRYLVEAKYKGKVVQAPQTLAARRRLFYQVLSMQGITPHAVTGMEQDYWDPAKNYYIRLKEKGPRNTIAFIKTIHPDNYLDFIKAAKAGYTIENRRPYAFTVVFSNFIADYCEFEHEEDVKLVVPPRSFFWTGGSSAETITTKSIWWDMDPAHDAARKWLISNSTTFVGDDGTVTPIPDSALQVVGPPDTPLGGYRRIRILLTPTLQNAFSSRKGTLKVRLRLTIIAGWTNGFSFNEINLITVANCAGFKPMPPGKRAYTLNHEMGHKVGMVASGTGFLPAKPPTYYRETPTTLYGGHVGPHCSKGAVYSHPSNTWSGSPGCVMFGADGAYTGMTLHDAPKDYCPACEKIVRKLDVDPSRLDGFKHSVKDF